MPVYMFEGAQGTSKSLTCTALLADRYALYGRKVASNTELKFPYTHFSLNYFLKHYEDDEFEDCDIWLDELYQLMDSRSGQNKLVKLLTYFVVQMRKRHSDMFVCTHHWDHIDKRVRRAVDIRATCQYFDEDPCTRCLGTGIFPGDQPIGALGEEFAPNTCGRCFGEKKTGWAVPLLYNRRAKKKRDRYSRLVIPAAKYWNYYETEERIPLTRQQMNINMEDL